MDVRNIYVTKVVFDFRKGFNMGRQTWYSNFEVLCKKWLDMYKNFILLLKK